MTGGLKLFFLKVLGSTASPLSTLLGVITIITSIFPLSTISSINVRSDEFTKLSTAGEAAVEEAALYP
ncbi:hypothetical protein Tco_0430250 [Tanacetum coccineum]